MTDIVERLRVKWDSMGDMANAERDEAAYAIICLRNECAMEVAHIAELKDQISSLRAGLAIALDQRDEARREVCKCNSTSYPHDTKEAYEIAAVRGWNCFNEDSK
jgi:hypothetical protein